MQLKLALQGKLSDVMEKHYSEGAKAVTLGITAATNGLKTSLREQVRSAGMSSRMANTWRGVVYPKGKTSISAAGQVYSNAEKIMQGFEYASIIRGKNGLWLAIPTDAIPKKARGKRMMDKARAGVPVDLELGYQLSDTQRLVITCHEVYLPKPKRSISGPGGIECTYDFQGAKNAELGKMVTVQLYNDVEEY